MRSKESHRVQVPDVVIISFYCKMEVIPGGTTAWMPL